MKYVFGKKCNFLFILLKLHLNSNKSLIYLLKTEGLGYYNILRSTLNFIFV